MQIYYNKIPSSHIVEADAIAPPGVNVNELVRAVSDQVGLTIIHEAAHGKRWAEEYRTHKRSLNDMNRNEEESIAEGAEQSANLSTDLGQNIFDDSEGTDIVSNAQILDMAVQTANARYEIFIPRNLVEDTSLGTDKWGEFEMIQGQEKLEKTISPHVAWSEQDRTLKVDVDAIVTAYNRKVDESMEGRIHPSTFQDDGTEQDLPGVSQQPPGSIPSLPEVPSIESRQ